MIKQQRLQELIEEKVYFRPHNGWLVGKCGLCNDYKDRAGFRFEDGQVIYNCWNCSTGSTYTEFSGRISKKMRQILHAYGIEDSEISQVVNSTFFVKKEEEPKTLSLKTLTKVNTNTPPVKLPPNSFKLGSTEEQLEYQLKLFEYCERRKIDLEKYQIWFSMESRYKDRIIIPYYRNGQLIYWQARSINPLEKKRYDNCIASRDAVMFNMDQLHRYIPLPLFVSEGPFDAMMFDGLATLGSKLTEAKIELLAQTKRRLIFVIDKDKNGRALAESILQTGWDITFAPDGADDINTSIQRYGKSWTAQQLMLNIPKSQDAAKLAIEMNCPK